jgi:hypothetical protein
MVPLLVLFVFGSTPLFPPLLNPERGFRMETEQITSNSSLATGLKACLEYNMTMTLGYEYIVSNMITFGD